MTPCSQTRIRVPVCLKCLKCYRFYHFSAHEKIVGGRHLQQTSTEQKCQKGPYPLVKWISF